MDWFTDSLEMRKWWWRGDITLRNYSNPWSMMLHPWTRLKYMTWIRKSGMKVWSIYVSRVKITIGRHTPILLPGTPLPRALSGAKVIQHQDTFFLAGGRHHSGEITRDERWRHDTHWQYSDEVIRYEPNDGGWRKVANMQLPRENPKAMIVSREIFPKCGN